MTQPLLNEFFKNSWALVQLLQRPALIISDPNFGVQVYLCDNFRPKGRDFFQNEVVGGQNVTDLLFSVEMHFAANNKYSIEAKVDFLPRLDFSFGHDSFTLLKSIR